MRSYQKEFFDFYGYSSTNDVACFVCYNQATDIHHIKPRGMGGSKCKDYIENLSALCRPCHEKAEHDPKFSAQVKQATLDMVKQRVKELGKF